MQPFRGPPPRGFSGTMPPPIAGMGGPPRPLMQSMVGGGVMPPRGGPMMFAPRGMAPGFPGAVPFGVHGMAAGPPGVTNSAPPPPGTVDVPVRVVELSDTDPMNVFVGKLPPDLHDSYIRQLLEKCGTVVTWKRTADPVTGKPKGFGYCTFATSSDVLRALRLLNGFFVDSREILVKVDSKSQAKLDVVTKSMTEKMEIEEQERDEGIKRELKNLFEVRSGLMGGQQNDVATWGELLEKKKAAATDTSSSSKEQDEKQSNGAQSRDKKAEVSGAGDNQNGDASTSSEAAPVQGERIRGKMIMSEIEKFRLAQEQREQEQEQKRREAVLERLRKEKEDEERRKAADERRREADERRKAAEARRKEAEEAAERVREDAAAARAKRKDEDDGQSSSGTDDENEAVVRRRKSSRSSRHREKERGRDRKKRSTREQDHDRKRSRDHRSRSRSRSREHSRRRRRSRKSRSRSMTRSRSRSLHRDRGRDRERRKRRHRRGSSDTDGRSDHDEDDRKRSSKRRRDLTRDGRARDESEREDVMEDKDRASIKVTKAASSSPKPVSKTPFVVAPKAVVMPKVVLGLKMASAAVKKEKPVAIPAVSAFVIEEEVVVKPIRELVPIDYTEEEKLAGASVQQRIAATVARINSRSEDVKSLIDQIPTATAELFAFPVDWEAVDRYHIVKDKMEPWVKKKIVEYLGEDEPTLLEFLLKKLTQLARPIEILEELQLVLDDDAEVFVKLLWRKLAFEAVRARINRQA